MTLDTFQEFACQRGTTTTGAVSVGPAPSFLQRGILIKADADNSGTVFVGPAGVTTGNGYALAKGESVFIPIDQTAKVFVIGSDNAQDFSWMAI